MSLRRQAGALVAVLPLARTRARSASFSDLDRIDRMHGATGIQSTDFSRQLDDRFLAFRAAVV